MSNKKSSSKIVTLLILLVGCMALWLVQNNGNKTSGTSATNTEWYSANKTIHITKHAKERMKCRTISLAEIEDVLQHGQLNKDKSSFDDHACATKYAVEGKTKDNQRIRVIAAPCEQKVNIVTVIDLDNEYDCE